MSSIRSPWNRVIPGVAVLVLIAACGGSGGESTPTISLPPPTTGSPAPDETQAIPTQEFDGTAAGFRVSVPADWILVDLIDSVPIEIGGRIVEVVADSPADGALLAGDIVIGIDGAPTPTMESVRESITSRQPGETLRFLIQRPDPTTAAFSLLDESVQLGTHPENGGPWLGIQFQTASIRQEFDKLAGIIPQAELNGYLFGTGDIEKLVAIHPTGHPALGVGVSNAEPSADYEAIHTAYEQAVASLGGEVTFSDRTEIDGRAALRIVSRQLSASGSLMTVFFFAVQTDSAVYSLEFSTIDQETDTPTLGDLLATFDITG